MRIEAMLTPQDVSDVLLKFVPLEIELGRVGSGERLLSIQALTGVTLVADTGVRVTCAGHIRWPVLGIGVPVRVRELTLVVKPSIQRRDGHESLVFRLAIEEADIAWMPASFDRSVTEKVNRDLAEHDVELAWDFTRTLSHVFDLPEALRTAASLGLVVAAGRVKVTESAIGLSVAFHASVNRRPPSGG